MNERTVQNRIYLEKSGSSQIVAPNFTPPQWFECDIWRVTQAGYAVEYEIKRTATDFRADGLKRRHGIPKHHLLSNPASTPYKRHLPARFYYVIPADLVDKLITELPPWAGLIAVMDDQRLDRRKAAPRIHSHKADAGDIEVARRSFYYRFWNERLRGKHE